MLATIDLFHLKNYDLLPVKILIILLLLSSCSNPEKHYTHIGFQHNEKLQVVDHDCNTYIMFFSPSYKYSNDLDKSKINELSNEFDRFSKSIYDNNCAIWCGENSSGRYIFNVALSKYYADIFDLNYNGGPYIVLLNKNPTTNSFIYDSKAIIVGFEQINPERIIRVLNELEKSVRTQKYGELKFTIYNEIFLSKFDNLKQFIREILLALAQNSNLTSTQKK